MASFQKHTSFFDKSFSDLKTSDYQLFLQVSKNGLSYTIFNPETNTFIGIESYMFNDIYNDYSLLSPLLALLNQTTLLQKKFKKIVVSYVNNRVTLIPKPIFQANNLKVYHQFNFAQQDEDIFKSDFLINLSAYNVYSIPDYIVNAFNNLSNVVFHHFSTALIESSLLLAKKSKTPVIVEVHVLPNSFQITVVKNQQLELYNTFNYQTSEDFIYYLLFVLNQLNIKNDETTIRLTGEVDKNSAIYDMLFKYIKTIEFCELPNDLNYSYVFEQTQKHYHYALFNLYLCE
ncbi:MAG: DUF3822 family protein [Flavobacteriales bacterium]|nr:DUF3822 family protein [Flavobacteriales bacterium]